MWDPTLIHEWVNATWHEERANPSGEYIPELKGRAKGLVIDARSQAVPNEPIWLKDQAGAAHPNFRQGGNHNKYPRMTRDAYRGSSMAGFPRE